LQEADERLFYTQTPESEADWFPTVPGPWKFENQEDFKSTRAVWEREIFRAVIGGHALQEPGPDAEDIPVRRPSGQAQPVVVAAIVTSSLGVLVGRRRDGKPPWTFIAGEQDAVKDENPADTAVREVKEETGLRIQAGQVIGERVHPQTGRTMIYIAAVPTHGTDVFVGDEAELSEVRWVSLAEAGELLPGMFGPVREHLAREHLARELRRQDGGEDEE
jgi:8-oxo-dGTP diphosphatase